MPRVRSPWVSRDARRTQVRQLSRFSEDVRHMQLNIYQEKAVDAEQKYLTCTHPIVMEDQEALSKVTPEPEADRCVSTMSRGRLFRYPLEPLRVRPPRGEALKLHVTCSTKIQQAALSQERSKSVSLPSQGFGVRPSSGCQQESNRQMINTGDQFADNGSGIQTLDWIRIMPATVLRCEVHRPCPGGEQARWRVFDLISNHLRACYSSQGGSFQYP